MPDSVAKAINTLDVVISNGTWLYNSIKKQLMTYKEENNFDNDVKIQTDVTQTAVAFLTEVVESLKTMAKAQLAKVKLT